MPAKKETKPTAAESESDAIETVEDAVEEEAPAPTPIRRAKVDRDPQYRALTAFSVTVDGCAYSFSEGAVFPASDVPFDAALMERVD